MVGVGEATLSPCALSIINDSFPPEKRGRPIGLYTTGMSVGPAAAYLAGAAVLTWTNSAGLINIPILGDMAPWQLAFIIVGLPGIILALLVYMRKEPERPPDHNPSGNLREGIGDALKFFAKKKWVYASFILPASVMTTIAYSQAWVPAMFERTWGMEAATYAYINGLLLLAFGPISNNGAGWLCDYWEKKGYEDAGLRVLIMGAIILLPTGILAPLMPNPTWCLILYTINTIGTALTSSSALVTLLRVVPANLKGLSVAFYLMCISLAGLLIGPTAVGILNDNVFGEQGVRYSMALVPLIIGTPVMIMIPFMRKHYLRELEEIKK